MAAELGLLSLTQLQKLAQSQQQQQHKDQLNHNSTTGSWMWNPNQATQDDEDSWEVRAFAEDTSNAMGTTWPPRSYTCTFCRREFRSAQALGGHMNVHRRDRARLHQAPAAGGPHHPTTTTNSSSPTLIIPTQELIKNGGLCFLYSLPNPNNGALFSHTGTMNAHINDSSSPSTLLSISPYPQNNLLNPNYPSSVNPLIINTSICHSSNTEPSGSVDDDNNNSEKEEAAMEELDLELRLGCRPSPS